MMKWLDAKRQIYDEERLNEQCGRSRCFQRKEHSVCVSVPLGKWWQSHFPVGHTGSELKELADYLKSLDGETRVVMEHTGRYYEPVARFLHEEGSLSVRSILNSLKITGTTPCAK